MVSVRLADGVLLAGEPMVELLATRVDGNGTVVCGSSGNGSLACIKKDRMSRENSRAAVGNGEPIASCGRGRSGSPPTQCVSALVNDCHDCHGCNLRRHDHRSPILILGNKVVRAVRQRCRCCCGSPRGGSTAWLTGFDAEDRLPGRAAFLRFDRISALGIRAELGAAACSVCGSEPIRIVDWSGRFDRAGNHRVGRRTAVSTEPLVLAPRSCDGRSHGLLPVDRRLMAKVALFSHVPREDPTRQDPADHRGDDSRSVCSRNCLCTAWCG